MSVSSIVTLGFGTFGSVNLLPTLGYGATIPTGHGKSSVGVPNIGHLAPAAAFAIRKWLAEQESRAARRRLSLADEQARRQAVIDRYARLLTQPRTHALSTPTRIAPAPASVFAFHPVPPPVILSISTHAPAVPRFTVDFLVPTVHNVSSVTTIRPTPHATTAFIDIAVIRRQDARMLESILFHAMMED